MIIGNFISIKHLPSSGEIKNCTPMRPLLKNNPGRE